MYEWRVDYTDRYSYHNWMTDQQLYCKSDFMIGLLGTLFFTGLGLMGLIMKLADKYGRKRMITVGCLFQLTMVYALMFSNDYRIYYGLLFFGGLSFSKDMLLYMYMQEVTVEKYQVFVGSYKMTMHNTICHIHISLYFYFGGKDWRIGYAP